MSPRGIPNDQAGLGWMTDENMSMYVLLFSRSDQEREEMGGES